MNLSRFLTSQTIALKASYSNTSFHVHEDLLRSVSPVLLAAVSRGWNKKATRRYKFGEDVTEELLVHFLMWLYKGSYHYLNTVEAIKDRDTWTSGLNTKTRKPKKEYLVDEGPEATSSEMLVKVPDDGQVKEPASDKQKAEETAEGPEKLHPLLIHIKLYVFAHMYMIEPLKTFSMEKIITILKEFESFAGEYDQEAVFDLLTFAFSRIPENDVMLHWLARYASFQLKELKQTPSSLNRLLLENDGKFAIMLVKYANGSPLSPFLMRMEDIKPQYQ